MAVFGDTRRSALVLFGLATLALSNAAAIAKTDEWPECVGKFEFDLPGEAVAALPRAEYMANERPSYVFVYGDIVPGHYLPDGKYVPIKTGDDPTWGEQQAVGLRLVSGPGMDSSEFERFKTAIADSYRKRKEELVARHQPSEANLIHMSPTSLPDAFVWMYGTYETVYMLRGNRIFRFEGSTSSKFPEDQDRIHFVSRHLRARSIHQVPSESGLCLHYGFLPDDPKYGDGYDIAVTYRLKDHPDIEIFFMDRYAVNNPTSETPAEEIKSFWGGGFHGSQEKVDKQRRILNAHIPGIVQFPSVKMGGYEGKASFVEMDHADGSLDYGYMAYVEGHAEANGYARTIMLYVIRTAARAKGVPVSKDELKAMAEGIAASVRLHPVRP